MTCPDKCGLLLEERMTEKHGSVVSTDYRWRRGCATDGSELTDNSEAKTEKVTGELGCTNVGQYSYDNIVVVSIGTEGGRDDVVTIAKKNLSKLSSLSNQKIIIVMKFSLLKNSMDFFFKQSLTSLLPFFLHSSFSYIFSLFIN